MSSGTCPGRIDRLQQTTLAGFVAMIAAILATGLLARSPVQTGRPLTR